MSESWRPTTSGHGYDRRRRPEVGEIVAYDYRAWQVTHVRIEDFNDEEAERAKGYRAEYRDRYKPYLVSMRRLYGEKHPRENSVGDIALRVPAFMYGGFDIYPDGRVPLCSCCGNPWPCIISDQERYAARELEKAEKLLALMPGCCPACGEPVTSRQRSITFDGPNVRNPLAEGPTFHLRRACYSAAADYENAWVEAEPGRSRSLLTLTCAGTVIVHQDGSAECFGADGSDCPSVYAHHRRMSACYIQTHGCARGCGRQGHPGTRIAGRPLHPRAVTQEVADRRDRGEGGQ